MTIGQTLWSALQWAKQDRQSLADAWGGDPAIPEVKEILQDLKDLARVQHRLFGTDESLLQKRIRNLTAKSIFDIMKEDSTG